MHKARAFFFVCAGIFLLALAYHLGAVTATAQAPDNPIVASLGSGSVVTANGDVYAGALSGPYPWTHLGNVIGGPTPATEATWGQVKAKYRQGAATQGK